MAKKRNLLEQMRANPENDWAISDVEKLARQHGLIFEPPSKSSHAKVSSPVLQGIQTIPYRRPIKPFYIRSLVTYTDAHLSRRARETADEA